MSEMELRMVSDRQEHDSKVKDQMGRTEQRYRTEIEAKEAEITEITDTLDNVTARLNESHHALEAEKRESPDCMTQLMRQCERQTFGKYSRSATWTLRRCA